MNVCRCFKLAHSTTHTDKKRLLQYLCYVWVTQLVCILMNMFFCCCHPQQTLVPFYGSMHKCYRLLLL